MYQKIFLLLGLLACTAFPMTDCGKQTTGNVSGAASINTEESISSAANESIGLSDITNSSQLGISDYGFDALSSSSCPVVTPEIVAGNPLTGTITLDFDGGCIPPFTNRTVSGMITMTVFRFTSGTSLTVTVDADHDIAITRWDGASLYVSGTTDMDATGTTSVRTRAFGITETRTALGPAGRLFLHQNIALNFTAQDTLSGSTVTQRILNGSGTIDHLLLKVLASVTASNLTYQQGSCHPVDGTITLVLTSDKDGTTIGTHELLFTSGGATLDGNPITLNPCD